MPDTPIIPSSADSTSGIDNTTDNTTDNSSGGGSIFTGIVSIISTVGSYFVSRETTKQKEIELSQLKEKYAGETEILKQKVLLEEIKLKQAEVATAQKQQNSKNLLTGWIVLVVVALIGFVAYLFLRPAKKKEPSPIPVSMEVKKPETTQKLARKQLTNLN